jgi:Cu+-exporting ATPase
MTTNFRLTLHNVSCAGCVKRIEATLAQVNSISEYKVNFAERSVTISGSATANEVIAALNKAGYQSSLEDEKADQAAEQTAAKQLVKQIIFAGVFGVFLLLLGMSPWSPNLATLTGQLIWLALGVVTGFGIWFSGRHIYKSAFKAFKNHHATMDTLITVGTGAAWLYSMVISLFPDIVPVGSRHVYFEAALIIIALVDLGALLEMRARGKTSQAIKRLIGLQAKTARRVNADGSEEDVAIELLKVGDVLRVRPGEKVAVDGEIIEGQSTIDESMLTGESMPVSKTIGEMVFGSTINKSGSFLFKATKVGKDTALAQIINLVKDAQSTKPPVAKLADVVSSFFAPTVIILAIITALVWFNLGFSAGFILVASITVLVIACPCALGLAAPISVIVGMGKSAEYGVLIRNGEALQKASQLDAIVLDKTGTITKGQPEVVEILTFNDFSKEQVLQLAGSLEQNSEHPLAQAILEKASEQQLVKVENFSAITGHGVKADFDGKALLLGNAKLMAVNQVMISEQIEQADQLAQLGQTPMYFAVDQELAAIISVADPIKADAKQAISRMQKMGLEVVMITGDNKKTAQAVAQQVGVEKIFAEVLPEDKAKQVKLLQQAGKRVAMVGDGINDAPALTQADVGFAIGAGTDVAIESADVTLISNSLQGIINAIAVSSATMRNIKQNLLGAFLYNSIGIPVAAGVLFPVFGILLSPMIAGAAMAASSLTVVSNANRLRFFKVKK